MIDEKLSCEDFEPHVGSDFKMVTEGVPEMSLTLTEAKTLKTQPLDDGLRVPFALLFEGPAPLLPQRIYRFEHGAMGQPEIFIVPIAKTENGFRYEAIFN
ncbi:hypothetical protein GCM10009087_43160 [Sphingomonas oligophenolica]|uniref:DUF6916 domain-containing protein n=1 Tax=Sphingomonas oligophenolica TaxID=301154 RepID=A0ABU9XZM0_9SPHN